MPQGVGYSFDLGQQGERHAPAQNPQSVKLMSLRIPPPQQMPQQMPQRMPGQMVGTPMNDMMRGLMKAFARPQGMPMRQRPMAPMMSGAPQPLF